MTKLEASVAEIIAQEVMGWEFDPDIEDWCTHNEGKRTFAYAWEKWNPTASAEQCFGSKGVLVSWLKLGGGFVMFDYPQAPIHCDAYAPGEQRCLGVGGSDTPCKAFCLAVVQALGHDIPGEE